MGHDLVILGVAFLLAGLLARAGARIGLPTIPLFMAAGIITGPNTPGVVLFEHPGELDLLAAFGLIFLLFYLGVEFSMDSLGTNRGRLIASSGVFLAVNVGAGLALGFAIGWGTKEALVVAGAVGISSSAIATKVITELRRLDNAETPLVLGIIVLEDVFLALYLAVLAPVLGDAASAADAFLLFLEAFGFLLVLAVVARYGAPVVGRVIDARDDELLVVLFVGFALLVAGAAEELGVSDAIGAFMAGLVLSTTVAAARVRRLVLPIRDAFAAIFFFAFGLSIKPDDMGAVMVPAMVAIVMTLVLTVAAGTLVARLNDLDRVAAANLSFTIAARGEFALILVALAAEAGLDTRLAPFVALYVLVLALVCPILASRSRTLARIFPRRLVEAGERSS